MSEEILINVNPYETRVAMVENGILQEIIIERHNKHELVGNIYKGKVCRILPGMQAAFVDIGLERAAFLHVADVIKTYGNDENQTTEKPIDELLHEGQSVLVQVIKAPLGTKGARLTMKISIPSRYVVFIPYASHTVGVSSKLGKSSERDRLRDVVLRHIGFKEWMIEGNEERLLTESTSSITIPKTCNHVGFIVRTVAEGVTDEMLCADIDFLCHLWQDIRERLSESKPHSLIYEDFSLVIRTIRDLVGSSVEKVRIDSLEAYQSAIKFINKFFPHLAPAVVHYSDDRSIFDIYSIEDEIVKALESRVFLKSGGYLVIDQTEAMTTIDVNTGTYVGNKNLEETIFKTNLEASQAIARQLRLRNLGGIIIIDFIDMVDSEHKRQVLRTLEKSLRRDRAKTYVSKLSSLGLVEMTRKRTRESLEHTLCESCKTCNGRGSVKTVETICHEILREILRESQQFEVLNFSILASQKVVDRFMDEESSHVANLEEQIDRSIKFQVEPSYTQEQYDIILV
jgi:ribonuclease G